jgi:hypothetical protein
MLDQHAAYLGRRGEESNWNEIPARRIDRVATRDAYSSLQSSAKSAMETAAAMADLRVVARTSACRVADDLVDLEDAGFTTRTLSTSPSGVCVMQ